MGRISVLFEFKAEPAALWASKNPILRMGEPGKESDTGIFAIGDGHTAWNDLPKFLPDDALFQYVEDLVNGLPGGGLTQQDLEDHVESTAPHPHLDDGTDFLLLYQNAKV